MSRFTPPCYVEKMTVYLIPDGDIVLDVGNQRLHVTTQELERIVHSHLMHHVVIVEILRSDGNGNNHNLTVVTE